VSEGTPWSEVVEQAVDIANTANAQMRSILFIATRDEVHTTAIFGSEKDSLHQNWFNRPEALCFWLPRDQS
jgi:hypothetical protein